MKLSFASVARVAPFVAFAVAISSFAGAGCAENPVGRICTIGVDAAEANQNIVASPALECQSRTCLHVQGTSPDMCTAECSSDSDCDKDNASPCDEGFACVVPVVVGPFCCKKMCVCKRYLVIPDGGVPTPEACDPGRPENECPNLH